MRLGITGHQEREGIDWGWVKCAIEIELASFPQNVIGVSALAEGADQVFAEVVLSRGGTLWVVIPMREYLDHFEGSAREHLISLLEKATHITQLERALSDEESYLAAGQFIVDSVDVMLAVWDGKPAGGLGGTADIVEYCKKQGKQLVHINPISRIVMRLP